MSISLGCEEEGATAAAQADVRCDDRYDRAATEPA